MMKITVNQIYRTILKNRENSRYKQITAESKKKKGGNKKIVSFFEL